MLGCLTCMIIVGYANQFKVTTNWKKTARLFDMQCSATDVGMLGNSKMPLVCASCLPVLLLL